MFEEILCLKGKASGGASIILAGVHGDETCGIEALKGILPSLNIERGQLIVGYGNPRAILAQKRHIDVNLNRMFKDSALLSDTDKMSYEYQRSRILAPYLDQAEVLLDIHASRTPGSDPFIICETNAKEIIEYLPIQRVVSGFDELEPGGTDSYMNNKGKIGICIECGYFQDPASTRIAEQSIWSFLGARKHISSVPIKQNQSYIRMDHIYITKSNSFVLSKDFKDFEAVSKGQVIGTDGAIEVCTEKDGIILFARNRGKIGEEAFLLGEKKNSFA